MKGQPKVWSFVESWANIGVGLVINITAQEIIFPLFGIHISHTDTLLIAAIFTVISLARSYIIRRWFNGFKYESK